MGTEGGVRYARSGDIDIAYKVLGDAPIDVVFVSGFVSHLDLQDDLPWHRTFVREITRFARLILFDKRGTGLSDRSLGFGSAADRMDDIRAVMDAADVDRAALFGVSEGGPLSILAAATYPDRISKLALYGTLARATYAPDYEIGYPADVSERIAPYLAKRWGTGTAMQHFVQAPEEALELLARYERNACTPKMVEEIMRANVSIDVREVLSTITVPTLVMHASGDPVVPVQMGRYVADNIPGARFVEVPQSSHARWDMQLFPEMIEFLSGEEPVPALDRLLATVLFTDIVGSTEMDAKVGDKRWRETLNRHDDVARGRIDRFGGRLVKTTGDGLLATFDSPARAIDCANEIAQATRPLGIDIRAGLHTGEIELRGDDISGLGVVIARRVCDLAGSDEILASRTVKDLVAGSGIGFDERGTHVLKGVPDDWQLYAVSA